MSGQPSRKRSAAGSNTSLPAKRQKRILDDTGRLTTAALLAEQSTSSVSSYLSIRKEGTSSPEGARRSLISLCLEVVADNFTSLFLDAQGRLRTDDEDARNSIAWLKLLSSRICNRLLRHLLNAYQAESADDSNNTRMTVSAMSDLFLKSRSVTSFTLPPMYFRAAQKQYDPNNRLDDDPENQLTDANFAKLDRQTQHLKQEALKRASRDRTNLLSSLGQCSSLRSLVLTGQSQLEDATCASLVVGLPLLEEMVLKGCTGVGDQTVTELAKQSGKNGNLKILNLNFTAVTVKGLKSLFARCKSLEVLKLANVNGLVDNAVLALLDPRAYLSEDWKESPLLRLTSLKLRSTKIGDAGLKALLALTPSLQRLDISYTQVRSLDSITQLLTSSDASLEKLVLSGLEFRNQSALQKFFKAYSQLPQGKKNALKTLKLGTLGMLDSVLSQLVPYLAELEGLEKISLFSNATLASGTGTGVRKFLEQIGTNLHWLDLSHIPLRGDQLARGLLAETGFEDIPAESPLRVLVLNNTHVDDDACVAISTLRNLEELYLEQARVTVECMRLVTEGCPKLRVVNLTGCRGIPTRQRRDWFEAFRKGEVGEDE